MAVHQGCCRTERLAPTRALGWMGMAGGGEDIMALQSEDRIVARLCSPVP